MASILGSRPKLRKDCFPCPRNLAPTGIAYVSYNTYPGWHLREIVRDLMRYHTDGFVDAPTKIRQSKAILSFLAAQPGIEPSIGQLLKEEMRTLPQSGDDSYLYHEFLETENRPVYFHQFMAGTPPVCSIWRTARFRHRSPPICHKKPRRRCIRWISSAASNFWISTVAESFASRCSVIKGSIGSSRYLSIGSIIATFALSDCPELRNIDIRNDAPAEVVLDQNRLVVSNRVAKAAVAHLREAWPRYLPFSELLATAVSRVAGVSKGNVDRQTAASALAGAVLAGWGQQMIFLAVRPPHFTTTPGERPFVSPLARWQAARNLDVTNQNHRRLQFTADARALVMLLDGTHDRRALAARLLEEHAAGRFASAAGGRSANGPG